MISPVAFTDPAWHFSGPLVSRATLRGFPLGLAFFWLLIALPPSAARASGYQFEATYTADIWSNVSGGIKTGTRYLDNLDVSLEIDTAEAWGFGGGTFFVYGLYNNHTTFSDELVGDLQVISNIEATRAWRIYEFWYEHGTGPWTVRLGLYDLNSEFDVAETRGLFLNSSHGVGPELSQTGENGPSIFPVTSLALRTAWTAESFTVRVAVLDGVPGDPDDPSSNAVNLDQQDGILSAAELDLPIGESGRFWAGFWRYSADFERPFGPGRSNDNDGWYIGVERFSEFRSRRMGWFARFGQANEQLNPLRNFIGAGITLTGPFSARPRDVIGLAVASGGTGSPYQESLHQLGLLARNRETNWELSYRAEIGPYLALQPDIQFVQNPSASNAYENTWLVGLRLEISW